MTQLVKEWFTWFAYQTGILGEIRVYQKWGSICMVILGILCCFLGFKVYRALFSVFLFGSVTIACCIGLNGRADWGTIVTWFAVGGTVIALLGYGWHRLGGCAVCGLIGMGFGWILTSSVWVAATAGVLAVILVLMFPVITICAVTALWGGVILAELAVIPGGMLTAIPLTVLGFVLQLAVSRRQTLFAKKYPQKVQYWLDQRKKG